MKTKVNIFHASMLVVGSAIGAGVLALPIVSGKAGLMPSIVVCVVTFLMMATTGWIMGKKYIENERVQSMQQFYAQTLGKQGKWVANAFFCVLCILLMTTYLKGMGASLAEILSLNGALGNACTVVVWGFFAAILLCGTHHTKLMNTLLVLVKTGFFAALLVPCFAKFDVKNAQFVNWGGLPALFPIFVGSFCFHNILPTICRETRNVKHLLYAIAIGLGMTFVIYLIFLIASLGMIPQFGDKISIDYAYQKGLPVTIILGSLLKSKIFSLIGVGIPIIAMSTAFIGVSEGFTQFIYDGLASKLNRRRILLILLPLSLLIVFLSGETFVKAMVWVGIIAEILFGLLPCLAWFKDSKKRQSKTGMTLSALLFALFAFTACFELYMILSRG